MSVIMLCVAACSHEEPAGTTAQPVPAAEAPAAANFNSARVAGTVPETTNAAGHPPIGVTSTGALVAADPVLDETACWRRIYRFEASQVSPDLMKSVGRQVLGESRYQKVMRQVQKKQIGQGGDWRDRVFITLNGHRALDPVPGPFPPDDWASVDFDDSGWVLERAPFQGGSLARMTTLNLGQYDESVDLRLQSAFYRTRFQVDDPGRAGVLSLSVVYSGGVRALVNGVEVARANLPDGPLGPDAAGSDYSESAYQPGSEAAARTLGVKIPATSLRNGSNVLAIEIRASRFHPVVLTNPIQPNWGGPQRPFPHARLFRLELGPASAAVPSLTRRPAGVQAWAEDMHRRVLSSELRAGSELANRIRLVAARNGTCSAQVVVGTDRALGSVGARTGTWKNAVGAALAADTVLIAPMEPYPVSEWKTERLGDERGLGGSFPKCTELAKFGRIASPEDVCLYDRIAPPGEVSMAADTSRPFWVSVRVPKNAAAGVYLGTVEVTADEAEPIRLEAELEVLDWALPDPTEFQTFVGCEQNPYAVARQYGVKLWSAEHFELLEASFRELARAGNTWLNVPVLANTEFGNGDDSMIGWTRKRDGSYAFDYDVMDRYVDLAVKHWGMPRAIQFVVMQGMRSSSTPPAPPKVMVTDERSGRRTPFVVGPALAQGPVKGPPPPLDDAQKEAWKAFAASLTAHMKGRGLEQTLVWGFPLETEADPGLKHFLAACAPGVFWAAGPHEIMANAKWARDDRFYRIIADIRWQGGWPKFRDDMGWKSPILHLANPRAGGTCFALRTLSYPFGFRVMPEKALAMGRGGFLRVGADEWADTHYSGAEIPKWLTGLPVLFLLWPGDKGAESSVRFEALIEGIQDAEARIFLEQALDRNKISGELAASVRTALARDSQELSFFQGNSVIHSMERYSFGWQERARERYRLAAEVERATGVR
ncbi:MAG: DUF4091 domain-containing protein [Planctomycetes bacterium]|nr:DUF4091 domain-containing protein [Planctomycetota bacterium]MBL7037055.1 DUF4091 domain-containing protein [Pirellulaceae bacterium]